MGANLVFSVFAAVGAGTVAVLAVVKGGYVVAAVFGLLAVGFVLRASERSWRG
jgi:hypothetical protein